MQMQKAFLAEYFCEVKGSPSVYQANILDRYLRYHKEKNGYVQK